MTTLTNTQADASATATEATTSALPVVSTASDWDDLLAFTDGSEFSDAFDASTEFTDATGSDAPDSPEAEATTRDNRDFWSKRVVWSTVMPADAAPMSFIASTPDAALAIAKRILATEAVPLGGTRITEATTLGATGDAKADAGNTLSFRRATVAEFRLASHRIAIGYTRTTPDSLTGSKRIAPMWSGVATVGRLRFPIGRIARLTMNPPRIVACDRAAKVAPLVQGIEATKTDAFNTALATVRSVSTAMHRKQRIMPPRLYWYAPGGTVREAEDTDASDNTVFTRWITSDGKKPCGSVQLTRRAASRETLAYVPGVTPEAVAEALARTSTVLASRPVTASPEALNHPARKAVAYVFATPEATPATATPEATATHDAYIARRNRTEADTRWRMGCLTAPYVVTLAKATATPEATTSDASDAATATEATATATPEASPATATDASATATRVTPATARKRTPATARKATATARK